MNYLDAPVHKPPSRPPLFMGPPSGAGSQAPSVPEMTDTAASGAAVGPHSTEWPEFSFGPPAGPSRTRSDNNNPGPNNGGGLTEPPPPAEPPQSQSPPAPNNATSAGSVIDSEIILDSADLRPSVIGPQSSIIGGYHQDNATLPQSAQIPYGATSVINSEIIIPEAEPPVFEEEYAYTLDHLDGDDNDELLDTVVESPMAGRRPMILPLGPRNPNDKFGTMSFQGNTFFIAEQHEEQKRNPVRMFRVQKGPDSPGAPAPQYIPQGPSLPLSQIGAPSQPPPAPLSQLSMHSQPQSIYKIPLDQNNRGPASTIVIYESGPSDKPLPPKVDQPAPRTRRLLGEKQTRCFRCFMIFLVILLFLIVITLAIVIPLLRLSDDDD